MRQRILAAAAAALLALGCAGCGSEQDKDNKKSADKKNKNTSSTVTDDSSEDEITTDEQSAPTLTSVDGQFIMQAFDVLQSSQYSVKLTYKDPSGFSTDIYRVVDGDDYFESQTNEIGESGCISVGGNAYDYDKVCNIYRKRTSGKPESLIETVVSQKLPATNTNIDPDDAAVYETEEYTYTGGTYMTVMDFYFDKETGLPAKYTTRYMVEEENGDEGMTETRIIKEILYGADGDLVSTDGESHELDTTVLDTGFISELSDFDSMTPEQKLGYCQAIFATTGVSADELAAAGMNDEKLRYISYEDFTSLVYTYCDL